MEGRKDIVGISENGPFHTPVVVQPPPAIPRLQPSLSISLRRATVRGGGEKKKKEESRMKAVKAPLRKSRALSPYLFTFLTFVLFVIVFYSHYYSSSVSDDFRPVDPPSAVHLLSSSAASVSVSSTEQKRKEEKEDKEEKEEEEEELLPFAKGRSAKGCDVFNGRWVRDELTRPLYKESECPYIQPQLTCQEHGRPERGYQYWRWQPHGCTLPSFNATVMLEALRGKRLLFVGDSLNRGQYVSMVCLLQSVIPEGSKSMESSYDSLTVFRAKDYNATIEFYWAPFLLESNSDNAVVHRITDRIVRKGSINKHGKYWKSADIVVFNTYLWWITGRKMKVLKGSFNDANKEIMELETEEAYRMAMKSMLSWVQKNMDLQKTRVFFTSMSPTHTNSEEWGGEKNGNCYNETTLIDDPTYWGSDSSRSIMQVIGEVFSKSKVPMSFLNITQLSSYRKDAHTAIYKKQWNPLTPEQVANPASYADCTHWCLPGLQDTWNELLYAKLFYP